MENIYQPQVVKIIKIDNLALDAKLFRLDYKNLKFFPGQFVDVSIPGFGEAPFGLASSPTNQKYIEIGVRKVGSLTTKLHELKVGDKLGVRGPLGQGYWPLDKIKKRNVLIVAGGCGILPCRSLILWAQEGAQKFKDITIYYGARECGQLYFEKEFKKWQQKSNLFVSLDTKPTKKLDYGYQVGVITKLFKTNPPLKGSVALVIGPPVMARFVLKELKVLGFTDEDIYFSLERRMECGIGICQHCAIGPYYVCQDGPVFCWADIKNIPDIL